MFPDSITALLVALIIALLFALVISVWIKNFHGVRRLRHRAPQPPRSSDLEFSTSSHLANHTRPERVDEAYRLWTTLTLREREVAELASAGKSTEEIARELSITTRTVSKHLEHIFKKLNIKSRAEIKYIRLHVVAPPESPPQDKDT